MRILELLASLGISIIIVLFQVLMYLLGKTIVDNYTPKGVCLILGQLIILLTLFFYCTESIAVIK